MFPDEQVAVTIPSHGVHVTKSGVGGRATLSETGGIESAFAASTRHCGDDSIGRDLLRSRGDCQKRDCQRRPLPRLRVPKPAQPLRDRSVARERRGVYLIAVARNGGDDPVWRDLANASVEIVGKENAAVSIYRHSHWVRQPRASSRAAVRRSRIRRCPPR